MSIRGVAPRIVALSWAAARREVACAKAVL